MMTLREALSLYGARLAPDTIPNRTDLIAAGQRAAWWRKNGPIATATVLTALQDDGLSLREIETETGIDHVTVGRLIHKLAAGEL